VKEEDAGKADQQPKEGEQDRVVKTVRRGHSSKDSEKRTQ
jgi:hypothetical protein